MDQGDHLPNGTPTCGVVGHHPDCTCDVVVDEVVVPRHRFSGVTHARFIANALGADVEQMSRAQFVDFLVELGDAYEALQRVKGAGQHRVRNFTEKRARWITYLREGGKVSANMDPTQPPPSGVEWHDVINIMTRSTPSELWKWNEERWDAFEKALRNADAPSRELGRQFPLDGKAMNISTVTRFWEMFHGPPLIRR